jgi:iron complex transport system substrate-binding protein
LRIVSLAAAALALAWLAASAAPAAPRVLSLDQCADQFVLALSPRSAIVGLSTRARNGDSHLRDLARGLSLRRADAEAALAAGPEVVVRYWGGDLALERTLRRRGAVVVDLEEATDFEGVRRNVRAVADALGRRQAGEAILARMDQELAASRSAWRGRRALYLTSGGATAGEGTLIAAILSAAGLTDAATGPGFHAVDAERLVLDPPAAVVEGFFDAASLRDVPRSAVRASAVRRVLTGRILVQVPGELLACPAWFAADAAAIIARRSPYRS